MDILLSSGGVFMGITISATNSKYSFDCGYGGFYKLRRNIALAYDEEFGKYYANIIHCLCQIQYDAFFKQINLILSNERFKDEDNDILDFLFESDCSGKISYKTCGKIYNLIKDIDFKGKTFTYVAHSDGYDYDKFKAFLKECYSHRRNMVWR